MSKIYKKIIGQTITPKYGDSLWINTSITPPTLNIFNNGSFETVGISIKDLDNKVDKNSVSTINGKSLLNGGNITIETSAESPFIEVSQKGFYIIDEDYNIGFYIDATGTHASNLVEYIEN